MALEWLFRISSTSRKTTTYKVIWDVYAQRGTCGWIKDSGEWAYSSGASVGFTEYDGCMFTIKELFRQIRDEDASLIHLSVDADEIPTDILLDLIDMLAVEGDFHMSVTTWKFQDSSSENIYIVVYNSDTEMYSRGWGERVRTESPCTPKALDSLLQDCVQYLTLIYLASDDPEACAYHLDLFEMFEVEKRTYDYA